MSVGVALLMTLPLRTIADHAVFLFFMAAVIFASRWGGLRPGLLAIALSALASYYFLLPDEGLQSLIALGVFVLLAAVISAFVVSRSHVLKQRSALADNLQLLLESTDQGMYGIDLQWNCTFVNRAAAEMFGHKPEELLGRGIHQLTHHTRRDGSPYPPEECPVSRALSHGEGCRIDDEVFWRRDGTSFPVEYSFHPIVEKGVIKGAAVAFMDITERKRVEAALRESEERLRLGQQVARIGTFDLNIQTGVNQWTPELEAMYGLPPGGFAGTQQSWEELVYSEDRAEAVQRVSLAMQGEAFEAEWRVIWPDGTVHWLAGRAWVFRDEAGEPLRLLGVNIDITKRKRAEEAQRTSEHRYGSLFENMLEGYAYCRILFDHDTPSDFLYIEVNSKFESLTGLKNVVGKKVSEVIPGFQETSLELIEIFGRVALTGEPERLETYVESLGTWFSISVYSPAKEHFVTIFDNITERKQTEVALHERLELREELAKIAATSPGVLYSFRLLPDGSNCFPYASSAVEDLFGLKAEDLAADGSEVFAKIHPDDVDEVQASIAESTRTFLPWSNEFRFFHPDRGQVWVMARSVPQCEADGGILWRGFALDITERKRSEEQLERLATAVSQVGESIVITDTDGKIQYVNPAFERTTGYSGAEVIGRNPRMLKSGKHPPEFYESLWNTIVRGETWVGRVINRKKDGSLLEEEMRISPVRDNSGKIINFIAMKRDMTAEVELESQFMQAQKMEAVGRLAGGVAHDFNNLLTVIGGYSDLLLRRLTEDSKALASVLEIKKASDRASALTRQLLAFSRKQILQPTVLDLNTIISDLKKMMGRLIGEDIDFVTIAEPGLGRVKADPGQVEQVLLNLVVNSRDAMPNGGQLTIQTANTFLSGEHATQHSALPGNYVMLSVGDTGCGMDDRTLEHIFEPFFTTKEAGKGTGLGLSTVYGIIKQSGGHIRLHTGAGQGTTFQIYLPRVDETADQVKAVSRPRPAPKGTDTVLLVEDEDQVRGILHEILDGEGYRVLSASNGEDALRIAEQHSGTIHLMVSDVVMPHMSGRELAERLTPIRPEMKVLYMSGYTDDAIVRHGLLDEKIEFVQKPFDAATIARKVRQVLDLL